MSVNDEFDLGMDDEVVLPPLAKPTKKKAARSEPVEDVGDHKAGWVRIVIDEVPGMNNYEVVGVNGKVYQIKRGTPVEVPPEVVAVLETAQLTHVEQKKNKFTGETEEVVRHFSAIPWRRA